MIIDIDELNPIIRSHIVTSAKSGPRATARVAVSVGWLARGPHCDKNNKKTLFSMQIQRVNLIIE